MIDGICQGYHWSFDEAVSRTIPQIIMLNHAAHVNGERLKSRLERVDSADEDDPVVLNGKTLDELNENELGTYFLTFSTFS